MHERFKARLHRRTKNQQSTTGEMDDYRALEYRAHDMLTRDTGVEEFKRDAHQSLGVTDDDPLAGNGDLMIILDNLQRLDGRANHDYRRGASIQQRLNECVHDTQVRLNIHPKRAAYLYTEHEYEQLQRSAEMYHTMGLTRDNYHSIQKGTLTIIEETLNELSELHRELGIRGDVDPDAANTFLMKQLINYNIDQNDYSTREEGEDNYVMLFERAWSARIRQEAMRERLRSRLRLAENDPDYSNTGSMRVLDQLLKRTNRLNNQFRALEINIGYNDVSFDQYETSIVPGDHDVLNQQQDETGYLTLAERIRKLSRAIQEVLNVDNDDEHRRKPESLNELLWFLGKCGEYPQDYSNEDNNSMEARVLILDNRLERWDELNVQMDDVDRYNDDLLNQLRTVQEGFADGEDPENAEEGVSLRLRRLMNRTYTSNFATFHTG